MYVKKKEDQDRENNISALLVICLLQTHQACNSWSILYLAKNELIPKKSQRHERPCPRSELLIPKQHLLHQKTRSQIPS